MSATNHKHTILYAEDDPDDLFMVQQAFQQYDGTVDLEHAPDGFQTLEQLKKAKERNALPCLIILDINMPGMDGKETLIRLKQSENFKHIPVVLFTTSSSDGDKAFAQKWQANFVTKPLIYSELEKLAKTFLHLCGQPVKA
jgi:CheY-like chemotaxis protein